MDVLLFHHALGLTDGVKAFADDLRRAGDRVVTPDLYDGKVHDSIEAGVVHAQEVGFETIIERGVRSADGLGDRLVAIGFSLGVLPAQKLAETRPGVLGAVLCHSAVPSDTFADRWPEGVALQLHFCQDDPWAAEDLDAAKAIAEESGGELFLYAGSRHLVADASFSDYDPDIAAQILARTLAFLDALRSPSHP